MKNLRNWPITKKVLVLKKSLLWTHYFLKNSGLFSIVYDRNVNCAVIRKEAHTIEKGLALPNVRPNFGRPKIQKLLKSLALSREAKDNSSEVKVGEDVLQSYVSWHQDNNHIDDLVTKLAREEWASQTENTTGGIIPYQLDFSLNEQKNFDEMLLSRRSVRNFSTEIVPHELIEEAIKVAWSSPSVCNRQPWAVAVVQEPMMIKAMLGLQAGNRGFEQTIKNLLVVLTDTKAFVEDYEVFEPFVDAGIFSGVLVNSLHARNVGSCCLNLCVSHHKAMKIIEELRVPKHFYPIMMIACGYPSEDCKVAISTRGEPQIFRK